MARAYSAGKLALSDPVERRRSFAHDNGDYAIFDPLSNTMTEQALDFTDGGFDVVFEVSGAPQAFRQALREMEGARSQRAKKVLLALSDPTTQPIPKATTKGACGAWPGTR